MNIDIQVPYTTRPVMSRRVRPLFNNSPDPEIIKQKQIELSKYGSKLYGEIFESVREQLVVKAAKHCKRKETSSLLDLALSFEEDFAIMYEGKLAAVCFCFPSGWTPSEKIGLTLSEIHKPVGDGEHLVRMSHKLSQTMADVSSSFERKVWTVTSNSKLSNLPEYKASTPLGINDLYLRMETQTTDPLGDGITSLFFVKVDVFPLKNIWQQYGNKIVDSINSMSDSVLDYKNLRFIKEILNRELSSSTAGSCA